MSRDLFHRSLVRFPASQDTDFAILLLSVCLTAYVPAGKEAISQDDLYSAVKEIQLLATMRSVTSLELIKALLLLSLFEYCTQRGDEALCTLTTTIRMSYSIKLDQRSMISASQYEPILEGQKDQDELNNLWWVLVICER